MHSYFTSRVACCYITVSADDSVLSNSTEAIVDIIGNGERVVVEHAFGRMKRYKAAADTYRNRKKDFDDHLMVTAAGLWNFYLVAA